MVIIEILSPRTMDYDYGRKFGYYRELPSLEEYILIAQREPKAEVFRKRGDGRWVLSSYAGLDALAKAESIAIDAPLVEIYAGVEFDQAT
jgi:Uma2 family endonuclease